MVDTWREVGLGQAFSSINIWGWVVLYGGGSYVLWLFSNTPDLHSLDSSSSPLPKLCRPKCSTHCWVSPGKQNCSWVRTTGLEDESTMSVLAKPVLEGT